MTRLPAAFGAVLLAASLAGCAGDATSTATSPEPPALVGTFPLREVDGVPLPAPLGKPIVDETYTITARALSGAFSFSADGTYEFVAQAEVVTTGIPTKQSLSVLRSGTYTYDETSVTLTSSTGSGTMTRSGNTLTSAIVVPALSGGTETVTMVFRR